MPNPAPVPVPHLPCQRRPGPHHQVLPLRRKGQQLHQAVQREWPHVHGGCLPDELTRRRKHFANPLATNNSTAEPYPEPIHPVTEYELGYAIAHEPPLLSECLPQ